MQADSGVLQVLSSEMITAQQYKIMNTDGTTSSVISDHITKKHKLLKAPGPLFCQLTSTAKRNGGKIVYV